MDLPLRTHGPLLGLLLVGLIGLSPSLPAQDAEKEGPKQTGLKDFDKPIVSEDPPFAFHIPNKRKFKDLREKWRVVDLGERKASEVEPYDKAIAEERGKDSPDEARVSGLEGQRRRVMKFYDDMKFLLEVEGDTNEFVRIQIETLSTNTPTLEMINPRAHLEQSWKGVKVLVDEETTSKTDRKKGQLCHSLIMYGRPESAEDRGLWRVESRVVPSKDKVNVYRVTYIHRMDARKFDADQKSSLREMELLFRLVQWP